MNITKNFTSEEFERSSTASKYGIDNTIPFIYRDNICELANVLQIVRDEWGAPIIINSGYRCKELNKRVGGASNSLHTSGLAVDFTAKSIQDNGKLFKLIMSLMKLGKLKIRTLIWEYGDSVNPKWIHLDINGSGHTYRDNKIVYYK